MSKQFVLYNLIKSSKFSPVKITIYYCNLLFFTNERLKRMTVGVVPVKMIFPAIQHETAFPCSPVRFAWSPVCVLDLLLIAYPYPLTIHQYISTTDPKVTWYLNDIECVIDQLREWFKIMCRENVHSNYLHSKFCSFVFGFDLAFVCSFECLFGLFLVFYFWHF